MCLTKVTENHSDDSSSSNNEVRMQGANRGKHTSFHQSDSDDMSLGLAFAKTMNKSNSLRMKHNIPTFLTPDKIGTFSKTINYSLESDSFNENSPARPSLRRKRKLKRMSVDETPVPPCGKRKRPQRFDPSSSDSLRSLKHGSRIKPLNQNVVDKIEKFCAPNNTETDNTMEVQYVDENGEVASESSVSWSGDEGHEGDDELTDWAPQPDPVPVVDCYNDSESREIRAGCRRLRDERPSFSITTGTFFLSCSVSFFISYYVIKLHKALSFSY